MAVGSGEAKESAGSFSSLAQLAPFSVLLDALQTRPLCSSRPASARQHRLPLAPRKRSSPLPVPVCIHLALKKKQSLGPKHFTSPQKTAFQPRPASPFGRSTGGRALPSAAPQRQRGGAGQGSPLPRAGQGRLRAGQAPGRPGEPAGRAGRPSPLREAALGRVTAIGQRRERGWRGGGSGEGAAVAAVRRAHGTLEYSWASFWYLACRSAAAAAISRRRLGL